MPSSVGHILAGLAVCRLTGGTLRDDWPLVLMAAAPDLDVVLSLARRRPLDYRNRLSHTAGAALAAGTGAGIFAHFTGGRVAPAATRGGTCYASHLLLDYFGKTPADGLPFLWPFSNRHFAARQPVFRTIYARPSRIFAGLLSRQNVKRILRETAILAPFILAAHVVSRAYQPTFWRQRTIR